MAVQLREEIVKYLYVNTAKDLNYRLVVDGESLFKDSLTINFNAPLLKLIDTATTPNSGQLSIDANGYTNLQASNHLYLRSGANKEIVFCTNTNTRAKFNSSGHFLPGAVDTYDIGTSNTRWKAIYANNVYATNTDSTAHRTVEVANSNGGVALQASNNRGLRDLTTQTWIIYTKASSGSTDTGIANLVHFEKGATSHNNITPSSNDAYTLGSSSYKWKNIYATQFNGDHNGTISGVVESDPSGGTYYTVLFIDTGDKAAVDTTKYTRRANKDFNFYVMNGTAETEGHATIVLGNTTATGTTGNKRGRLRLYGTNTGYATLQYTNSTAAPSITIPEYSGYLTASATSQQNYTSEKAAYVPFYTQNYKQLGMNNGFRYYTLEGTTEALGYGKLYLGNGTSSGTAGNKYGLLKLYNINGISVDVRGNDIGTYGGLRTSGLKGSYHGILLGNATSALTIMSKDGSDQGLYNEAISKWLFYHNGAGSICLLGSSVVADYPIVLNAATNVKGNVLANATGETNRSIRVKNDNGEVGIYTSTTNRGLYDFTNSHWIIYVKKDVTDRAYIPTTKGLTVENTTDASSTTTGALVVNGGVGVVKNIYSGQKINAAQGFGVNATTGTGVGISLYGGSTGTSAPSYGLMFAKTTTFGTHGGVSGEWATYFTMNDSTDRGWIFRRGTTNIASVSGTGYLTLNAGMNLGGNITYNNGSYTDYEVIKFITGTNDGTGIIIGGGGLAIFGSGESASNVQSKGGSGGTALTGGTEYTYITSDGGIDFITNCQTWDSRRTISINTAGQIVRAAHGTSWWSGRDVALIRQNTSSGYAPILSMKTTNGSWELGHYNSSGWHDDFLFNYKDDASYANGSDSNSVVHAARLTKDGYLTLANGLLVNGTARFAIESSDAVTNKRFIIGTSGNRYLSFGGAGVQAYLANDSAGTLYLNNEGGLISTGSGGITTGGNIYPKTTNSKTVGTASYNWSAVHARALTSAADLGITSTTAMTLTSGGNFSLTTTGTTTLSSSSTIYIKTTAASSIIFQVNGTERARFNTSGHFIPGADNTYNIGINDTTNGTSTAWASIYGRTFNAVAASQSYAYLKIQTIGTTSTQGVGRLSLGNSLAAGTDKNARGHILFYGTGTAYLSIYTNVTTTNRTWYFRDHGGTAYSVAAAASGAVGGSTNPVYVNSNGMITACGSLWTNSSTSSTQEFQVGARSAAGTIYMYANGSATGNRGIYGANNGGTQVSILSVDKDNQVSLNGNAATASKWLNARTITIGKDYAGSVSIDGSANKTLNITAYKQYASGGDTATYPWHRIAYITNVTGTYSDYDCILDIRATYDNTKFGRIKISYRTNNSGVAVSCNARWLYRSGFELGDLVIASWGVTGNACYADVFVKVSTWPRLEINQVYGERKWTLVNSNEGNDSANPVEAYVSVAAAGTALHSKAYTVTNNSSDAPTVVNYSHSTGSVAWASITGKPSFAYLPLAGGTMTGQITGKTTSTSWIHMTKNGALHIAAPSASSAAAVISAKTSSGSWGIGTLNGSNNLYFVWGNDTNYNNGTNTTAQAYIDSGGGVHGAVWNDYAEYRTTVNNVEPGRVVVENNDDTLSISTDRLMPGANIVSDTFGFAIGETDEAKTPLAVSGRALAYPFEPREEYCAGDPVCSGPNGTVSKMTREEVMMYPDRMIGTVSAIPSYKTWGTGNVPVNGRIWIKVI